VWFQKISISPLRVALEFQKGAWGRVLKAKVGVKTRIFAGDGGRAARTMEGMNIFWKNWTQC